MLIYDKCNKLKNKFIYERGEYYEDSGICEY